MKKLTKIRNEKPIYFVSIYGDNAFESESLTECKKFLCDYIKEHREEIEKENELYNYYIGMYSIDIMY